jgi:hypothetical protein
LIDQLEKTRKKFKKKLRHEADPEMDFVFWSKFEKVVEPKSWGAKLWAPALLMIILGLVALSALQQTS